MTIEELNRFIEANAYSEKKGVKKVVYRAMKLRCKQINESFEFTDENIQKIASVNARMWQVSVQLSNYFGVLTSTDYIPEFIAHTSPAFVTARIYIYTETDLLQNALFSFSNEQVVDWTINNFPNFKIKDLTQTNEDWNKGILSHNALKHIKMCNASYHYFEKLGIYSLYDMCQLHVDALQVKCIDDEIIRGAIDIGLQNVVPYI